MPSTAAHFTAHLNLPGGTPHPTPATLVRPGDTVVLHFSGPPGEHTLYSDNEPSGEIVTFPYTTRPLTRDCVFTLKSRISGMIRYNSLTVSVDRPVLPGVELGELAGGPALSIPAPLTITGPLAVEGEMDVTGTCSATTVVALGPVQTQALMVSAGTVTGLDSASRLTSDGELTVAGTLQSDECLSVRGGPVEIFDRDVHSGPNITPCTPASGDGFIVTTPHPAPPPHRADVQLTAVGVSNQIQTADRLYGARGAALAALPIHRGDQLSSTAPDGSGSYYHLIRFSTGS